MIEHHGLGRVPRFDARSRQYSIRNRFATAQEIRNKTWRRPQALDQGETPMCVGYAMYAALNSQPLTAKYPYSLRTFAPPESIYHGAQAMDEWEGENYEGSSGLGGAQFLKSIGAIQEYRWCFGLEDVLQTLSWVGPVCIGSYWKYDMFNGPDPDPGYHSDDAFALSVTGANAGGHEYELHGIDVDDEVVIGTNSWGVNWGDDGRFYLKFDDLERLLENDGDAVVLL